MKTTVRLVSLALLVTVSSYLLSFTDSKAVGKAGCDAYMYVANNSLFEINVYIDNVGVGNVLVGKTKTFTYELISDTPKRVKVRCDYQDPNFIDPKSFISVTKTKVECGQTDTVYFAFAK